MSLLQTMPGIDLLGAAMLLVEIGTDMDSFGSAERLASWVGICPGNNESAGKRKSGRTRKGNAWVRRLLCEFAQAASRSRCALKDKFSALAIRKGHKSSIVALAHKMLRIVYAMLARHNTLSGSHRRLRSTHGAAQRAALDEDAGQARLHRRANRHLIVRSTSLRSLVPANVRSGVPIPFTRCLSH